MHLTTLRKIGGSVMLAVPPALLDLLRLRAGDNVGLAVENGRLIVRAHSRPRYTLDELLAECGSNGRRTKEMREWVASKPVGREIL